MDEMSACRALLLLLLTSLFEVLRYARLILLELGFVLQLLTPSQDGDVMLLDAS